MLSQTFPPHQLAHIRPEQRAPRRTQDSSSKQYRPVAQEPQHPQQLAHFGGADYSDYRADNTAFALHPNMAGHYGHHNNQPQRGWPGRMDDANVHSNGRAMMSGHAEQRPGAAQPDSLHQNTPTPGQALAPEYHAQQSHLDRRYRQVAPHQSPQSSRIGEQVSRHATESASWDTQYPNNSHGRSDYHNVSLRSGISDMELSHGGFPAPSPYLHMQEGNGSRSEMPVNQVEDTTTYHQRRSASSSHHDRFPHYEAAQAYFRDHATSMEVHEDDDDDTKAWMFAIETYQKGEIHELLTCGNPGLEYAAQNLLVQIESHYHRSTVHSGESTPGTPFFKSTTTSKPASAPHSICPFLETDEEGYATNSQMQGLHHRPQKTATPMVKATAPDPETSPSGAAQSKYLRDRAQQVSPQRGAASDGEMASLFEGSKKAFGSEKSFTRETATPDQKTVSDLGYGGGTQKDLISGQHANGPGQAFKTISKGKDQIKFSSAPGAHSQAPQPTPTPRGHLGTPTHMSHMCKAMAQRNRQNEMSPMPPPPRPARMAQPSFVETGNSRDRAISIPSDESDSDESPSDSPSSGKYEDNELDRQLKQETRQRAAHLNRGCAFSSNKEEEEKKTRGTGPARNPNTLIPQKDAAAPSEKTAPSANPRRRVAAKTPKTGQLPAEFAVADADGQGTQAKVPTRPLQGPHRVPYSAREAGRQADRRNLIAKSKKRASNDAVSTQAKRPTPARKQGNPFGDGTHSPYSSRFIPPMQSPIPSPQLNAGFASLGGNLEAFKASMPTCARVLPQEAGVIANNPARREMGPQMVSTIPGSSHQSHDPIEEEARENEATTNPPQQTQQVVPSSLGTSKCLALGDTDKMMIKWRSDGKRWLEISDLFAAETGRVYVPSALHARYKKALKRWPEEAQKAVQSKSAPPADVPTAQTLEEEEEAEVATLERGGKTWDLNALEAWEANQREIAACLTDEEMRDFDSNEEVVPLKLQDVRIPSPEPLDEDECYFEYQVFREVSRKKKVFRTRAPNDAPENVNSDSDSDSDSESDSESSGDECEETYKQTSEKKEEEKRKKEEEKKRKKNAKKTHAPAPKNADAEADSKKKDESEYEDEIMVEPTVVGASCYHTLHEANAAAGREIRGERFGAGGIGHVGATGCLPPGCLEFKCEAGPYGMARQEARFVDDVVVRVWVDRFIRAPGVASQDEMQVDGDAQEQMPDVRVTPHGWQAKSLWVIKRKDVELRQTTKVHDSDEDDEEEAGGDVMETEESRLLDIKDLGVFTVLTDANREAARLALDYAIPLSFNIDKANERREMQRHLDDMVQQHNSEETTLTIEFEGAEETLDNVSTTKRIDVTFWVECTMLQGPRNI